MKKNVILLLVLLLASVLLLMGCDEEPNDTTDTTEAETTSTEPYTLEFVSNGDKTCTVRIVTNSQYKEFFDVSIPETSPEGETVVATADGQFRYCVPIRIEKSEFEELILNPLEAYYGVTYEEAKEIWRDSNNPLAESAFQLYRYMEYYRLYSLSSCSDPKLQDALLEAFPILSEMDIYVLESKINTYEKHKLNKIFHEIGVTVEDVEKAHQKVQYVDSAQPCNDGWYIRSVELPATLTKVGYSSFSSCSNLANITLPAVCEIGAYGFYGCTSLSEIVIPDSVKTIGSSAFYECSNLTSITIPDSVMSIGKFAFDGCDYLRGEENGVYYVDGWVVGCDSDVITVDLRTDTRGIADEAFDSCSSLTSITIPNSVMSIGEFAFDYCSNLESITIPESVTSIGMGAIRGCSSLTNIIIPDGVTRVADRTFENCVHLTSITIPNSVTSIGERVLRSCGNLTDITFQGTIAEWQAIEKGNDWNADTPAYTIHCTDGDIVKE